MQNLHKIVSANRPLFIFIIGYLVIRVLLLNANYTEWGDTFRMIRAADYLSNGSWPWDEKRWPLYSVFLIPGIWLNAPIFWGRMLSIFISTGSIVMIYAFYLKFISRKDDSLHSSTVASQRKLYALLASIFAVTSSIFGYWSIRVMADPLFALLILIYFYYLPDLYKKNNHRVLEYTLSGLLLAITMTRLEGIFVALATALFFLIYPAHGRNFTPSLKKSIINITDNSRKILIFFIPQVLIYFPWTLYAKVLYKGEVSNDYLDEIETFVFNLERFKYFFTYTFFILVIPLTAYFIWNGVKSIKESKNTDIIFLIPLLLFILQELLIGFIWTPSLPRIYMPLIPFLAMLFVFGIENFRRRKVEIRKYLIINLSLTFLFVYLQYNQKLYFLGASKLLFAIIIISNLFLMFFPILKWESKKVFVAAIIILNLLITSVVIYNQSYIYKSVVKGIEFVTPLDGITAYSDETGNAEWYLRSHGFYLDPGNNINDTNEQYQLLKSNNVSYMLWTNEFNRASYFIDPKIDPRFELIYVFQQPIRDPLDKVADRLNILDDSDYMVFTTKIYKVL